MVRGAHPPPGVAERASRSAITRAGLTRTLGPLRSARSFPRGAENGTRGGCAPRAVRSQLGMILTNERRAMNPYQFPSQDPSCYVPEFAERPGLAERCELGQLAVRKQPERGALPGQFQPAQFARHLPLRLKAGKADDISPSSVNHSPVYRPFPGFFWERQGFPASRIANRQTRQKPMGKRSRKGKPNHTMV